jgi:alpha-methylacyl-CoA racemase
VTSGAGQVVDAAIVDGVMLLDTLGRYEVRQGGRPNPRGANAHDGGSHYYNVYQTSDGGWITVGAIEPRFYAALMSVVDPDGSLFPMDQADSSQWPFAKERLRGIFGQRSREDWMAAFEGVDACVAPVLTYEETESFAHHMSRSAFTRTADGKTHPSPSPRFSRSGLRPPEMTRKPGQDSLEILRDLGLSPEEVGELMANGVTAVPD